MIPGAEVRMAISGDFGSSFMPSFLIQDTVVPPLTNWVGEYIGVSVIDTMALTVFTDFEQSGGNSDIYMDRSYFVMTAESAKKAMDLDLDVIPDLLILDKMMPGMDGFELAEKLKSEESTSSIRVILLTSCDSPDDFVEGLDAGADDYVTKPLDPKVLMARVRSQLRTKALIDRLVYENKMLKDKIPES